MKKSSWDSLKRKLKQLTKKTKPYSFEERLQKLREVWRGWVNNYRLASIQAKLKQLDEWLRNRLRYCIWHNWKRPERKRKNLVKLGVEFFEFELSDIEKLEVYSKSPALTGVLIYSIVGVIVSTIRQIAGF